MAVFIDLLGYGECGYSAVNGESLSSVFPFLSNEIEYVVFPGFCDVHVHFREPGFSYKDTIADGCRSAARGGYTAVCTMPNLDPVPDNAKHLKAQTGIIARDASVCVYPYGAITMMRNGEQLADLEGMTDVIAFSDDGSGVQDAGIMREAMYRAKALGKIIAAHCEDASLLTGGSIHAGRYASSHGLKGISSESEYRQLERDLRLAEETECAYHVCHISTAESVSLIRDAKASGIDVTCETAPHYLTLTEDDLVDDGCFKMNPPLREQHDRDALLEGLTDGTIDMIATDHAPHSAEEKSRGLIESAFGIVGLETAFPVLYTALVRTGVITLEKLTELLAYAPRKRFGIPLGDDVTVWDLNKRVNISSKDFLSKGRSTPFEGRIVYGECAATVCAGKTVWHI